MALYLVQVEYTPEAAAALVNNPQDRSETIRPSVEKLGGKLEHFWISLGKYDTAVVVQMPDPVSAAALELAVLAGGVCKSIITTPLLTVQEGMEAMKKAAASGYKPPSR